MLGSVRPLRLPLLLALAGCTFDTAGLRPPGRSERPAELADLPGPPGDRLLERARDLPRPLELGCPSGFLACGALCVDPKLNFQHCSGCGKSCDPASSDRCEGGACVCGATAAPCPAGLDCVSGSCICFAGGRCQGCCEKSACLPGTTLASCGAAGASCLGCDDGNPCTTDSCAAGSCKNLPLANGSACDDGKFCTVSDNCVNGVCTATPRSCPGDACNLGVCHEASASCGKQPKSNGTPCGRPDHICVNGKCIETS